MLDPEKRRHSGFEQQMKMPDHNAFAKVVKLSISNDVPKLKEAKPLMFCPTCGIALSHQTKYCNRCGAHLTTTTEEAAVIKATEKRLDEYLDGLFWITVFGLGLILGGVALMKKLQVGDAFMLAFLILSSAAFLVNFGLSLREIQRMRRFRELKRTNQLEQPGTAELAPPDTQAALEAFPSVTENTTRSLAKEKFTL